MQPSLSKVRNHRILTLGESIISLRIGCKAQFSSYWNFLRLVVCSRCDYDSDSPWLSGSAYFVARSMKQILDLIQMVPLTLMFHSG